MRSCAIATHFASAREIRQSTVARAVIPLAHDQLLSIDAYPLAISRDGKNLVYAADDSGKIQLNVRALADTMSHVLPGTEGASTPFFAPDGEWIGFFAHGILKKVQLSGGAPIDIAAVPPGENGADWGADGTIFLGDESGQLTALRPDGSVRWTQQFEGSIRGTPQLDGKSLYIATAGGTAYRLDRSGALSWRLLGADHPGHRADERAFAAFAQSRQRQDHVPDRWLRLLPRHAQTGRSNQARRRHGLEIAVRHFLCAQHLARSE